MRVTAVTLLVLFCTACANPPPAKQLLRGVVAIGGPLGDAQVMARDSRGATATSVTDAQGHYVLDASALRSPVVITATEAHTDTNLCMQSKALRPICMVALLDPMRPGENRANINPLTDWVASDVALQLGKLGPQQLALAVPETLDPEIYASALFQLRAGFGDAIAKAGVAKSSALDPLTIPMKADGTGLDAVLRLLNHNRGYDNDSGKPAATTLTDMQWRPIAKPFGEQANEALQWERGHREWSSILSAPVRVFVVGDSTAATYERQRMPRMGWGQVLQAQFQESSGVQVVNGARAGRSSRDFLNGGWYRQMTRFMRPGDYVLIAHGHNDQNCNVNKPMRGAADVANLCTYPNNAQGQRQFPTGQEHLSFQNSLAVYILDARARGAIPVLLTPTVRFLNESRKAAYQGDDRRPVVSSHWTRQDASGGFAFVGNYSQTIRDTAKAYQVPLIELEAKTIAFANRHAQDWTDYWLSAADTTHFQEKGAKVMASLVAEGVRETPALGALAQWLK
jgi:lysophospholipase L1-like esterase